MKMIVVLFAMLFLWQEVKSQNLKGTWHLKTEDEFLAHTRDLWLYIDNDSDSFYAGHTITVFYTSFGAEPDTIVSKVKGYSDKGNKKIYLQEYEVVNKRELASDRFEKFVLTYSKKNHKVYLRGMIESRPIEQTTITSDAEGNKVVKVTDKSEPVKMQFLKVRE